MSYLDDVKLDRLKKSTDWAIRQMEFPRNERILGIKQLCGSHYQEGGNRQRVPVNFIKMAVDIYVRLLAPRNPRVIFSTLEHVLKSTAVDLGYAVNQIPDEINLLRTLRRTVTEALFSWGIMKVGLHTVGDHMGHPYGKSFVDNVTIDDYFFDFSAHHIEEMQYEGNDYWLNYEDVMDADWVKKSARAFLKPTEPTTVGEHGEERAQAISSNEMPEVFKERIWLRDVWLPEERIMATVDVENFKLLREVEWDGPERGPYPKISFADVPGNIYPLPPVAVWRDLHELGNSLFRKLANQGDSEKTVLGFDGTDEEGVQNFKGAMDGDGIVYKGRKPEMLTAGGIKEKTLAFYLQTRDLSSYFAGNIDSLGGLSAMTETVGQDRLLTEAANAQLRDMSQRTTEGVEEVMLALAYYEWHDPIGERSFEKSIPGADGLTIQGSFGQDDRRGDFDLYDLEVDVYSMQDNSPQIKLQKLLSLVNDVVMPMHPLIQAAGGTVDVQKIINHIARYSDMDELNDIVQFSNVNQVDPSADAGPKTTSKSREVIQKSGATREGQSAVLQQQLLGKGMQEGEAAR